MNRFFPRNKQWKEALSNVYQDFIDSQIKIELTFMVEYWLANQNKMITIILKLDFILN